MPDSELATVVPVTSRKRRKHSSLTSVSEQEKLPTKRKLNLGELDSDSSGLAELDISMLDADFSTLYSSEELDRVLVGEKDHGLNDFISISVDDYQPDGSGLPHLPITSTETENIPPTPNALDFCSTLHGVGDAPVGSEATSTHKTMSSMGASDIAEAYMKFFDSSLSAALEGLDNSTIIYPQRRKVLETVYVLIPAGHNVARVAAARTGLQRLICISSDMQETRKTVTLKSQEQEAAIIGADKDHALLADALKATNEKLSSMERQHDEKIKHLEALNAQVEEATNALHKIKKGVKELKSKQSNQQAEAKKLRDTLSEVNTKTSQELEALQKKMSTMGDEVGSFVESMKKSLPPSC